jgi:alpha-glucoside transport system permease protein
MSDRVSTFAKKPKISTENHFSVGKLPIYLVLLILVLLWTIPSFGLFVSSFRYPQQISNYGWWQVLGDFNERLNDEGEPRFRNPPPEGLTLDNYQRVLGTSTGAGGAMGSAFLNSLLVVIPSTVIPITIAAFAAYAIAWLNWVGRRLALFIIVGLLVVPLQMSLIPILRIYTRLGLNGSFLGIWLAHTGFGLPLATYILYGYISGIPGSIIESAYLDGATPWQTFTRLILPLSVPAIASFAIFQFLWVWNDLLVALVFLTRGNITLVTTRLQELVGSRGQDWQTLTAGAFVSMVLPLVVFFSLQRYFIRGMMAGSVKG